MYFQTKSILQSNRHQMFFEKIKKSLTNAF
jgi:hypothetical protein